MKRPQQFDLGDVDITHTETLYQGFYTMEALTVRHAAYRGGTVEIRRELMVRPNAVVVLLYDPRLDEVVLIEQYRVGAHSGPTPWLIECVAGLIEPGESTDGVARREAEEEAGLSVGRLHFICEYFPSPGGSTEKITLYAGEVDASSAGGVHGLDADGEDILVHRVTVKQALAWLSAGHVNNAASIIGLQWLALHHDELRSRWQTPAASGQEQTISGVSG
ncbi:NUDIX domain-containing protein [Natronospirillum operosum]|uniref:ADP-ribose pyrophosphatase n=1 Tax=Natronospirillum operosum TaxID=2759953 RepID=A0A4Z0W859_9GAMM|nr:NUDIX domain-containing protein [Natronospirillum operosum]TGG92927.1 NUDIX domain-containing protein [Natronospirillum operosum]